MKKILTAALSLALLGAIAIPVWAADSADSEPPQVIAPAPEEAMTSPGFAIEIDGEDAGAQAHIMVPLRAIAEKLGFTVTWNNGAITVTGAERYAELTIGVDQYFAAPTKEGVMGASLFSLGCAPVLMNDAAYVPVELFDALLGCKEGTVILEGGTVKINTDPGSMNSVQIPSPFTDRATLADAAKVTGFPMSAPETLEGCPQRVIQTMGDEMIQVIYQNGNSSVTVRKEEGSGDISGDYNQYAQSGTVEVNGSTVTMRGENNLVMVAIWENGGYTYAVTSGAGMSTAAMTALIRSVN